MRLFCSKCGKEIPEIAKFCPFCGEEVILNRNNPDAKEINKEDLEKQQEEVNQETVDKPVVQTAKEEKPVCDEKLAQQYRQEIERCKKNRKVMVTSGIIIAAVFLSLCITFLVFAFLRSYELSSELGTDIVDFYLDSTEDELLSSYSMLASLSMIMMEGGVVLIILGAVINSKMIKNRQKILDEYVGKK